MKSRMGLTMIEVLIATALFAITFLVFMDVWPTSARSVALARGALGATTLAEQRMESIISGGFTAAATSSGTVPVSSSNNGIAVTTVYTYTVTVTTVSAKVKDVVVGVQWQERGVVHSVLLETLLASAT